MSAGNKLCPLVQTHKRLQLATAKKMAVGMPQSVRVALNTGLHAQASIGPRQAKVIKTGTVARGLTDCHLNSRTSTEDEGVR